MTTSSSVGLLLVSLIGLVGLVACERDDSRCHEEVPAPIVDETLLAFLGKARAAHHSADLYEDRQQPQKSIALLEALTQAEGAQDLPEIREVLADTHARLAALKGRAGKLADAQLHIMAGLKLAKEQSYFRGHLFEVRGILLEEEAKRLEQEGDTGQAKVVQEQALKALEESMRIQSAVIDRAATGRE